MHLKIEYDDTMLKSIKKNLKQLHNTHTEWGWINEKVYPASDQAGRGGIKIAEIARINEYGGFSKSKTSNEVVNIPARPYFRQALMATEARVINDVKKIFIDVLHNKSFLKTLDDQARLASLDIIQSIQKQNMQALSKKTISIKGHAVQWVDTGVLLSNITYKVYRTNLSRAKDK